MDYSIYRITLDIHTVQSQATLPIKLGDTSRKIYITLMENGVPYKLKPDCFAVFSARKPDGNVLENNCVIEDDIIKYDITAQTSAATGKLDCEIKLYGKNSQLIVSPRFTIIVDTRAVGDADVESASEFSALTQLYSDTNQLHSDTEQLFLDTKILMDRLENYSVFEILDAAEDLKITKPGIYVAGQTVADGDKPVGAYNAILIVCETGVLPIPLVQILIGDKGGVYFRRQNEIYNEDGTEERFWTAWSSYIPDIDGKVSKEAGKGLSSNDYTDEEKAKTDESKSRLDTLVSGGNINSYRMMHTSSKSAYDETTGYLSSLLAGNAVKNKVLSDENYTVEDKSKLAAVEEAVEEALNAIKANRAEAVSIIIPITDWTFTGTEAAAYPYFYDIAAEGVTAKDRAEITISPDGIETAKACGLCPINETLADKIRVRSISVPTAAISAEYWIEKGRE